MTRDPRGTSAFDGRGDEVYDLLTDAHARLDDAQSYALNARLVLLLANQIGDVGIIRAVVEAARASVDQDDLAPP